MQTRSAQVLLVEDDPTLGPITLEVLRAFGHRPQLAASAEAALRCLSSRNEFDVVLLDLRLPNGSGEAVVTELRANNRPVPPIVILSAEPSEVLQRAARSTQAVGVLQKPCSGQDLIDALDRALA